MVCLDCAVNCFYLVVLADFAVIETPNAKPSQNLQPLASACLQTLRKQQPIHFFLSEYFLHWHFSNTVFQTLHRAPVLFSLPFSFCGCWTRGHQRSACKKGASPRRFVLWLLCACVFCFAVSFRTAGCRGTWLQVLSWGS